MKKKFNIGIDIDNVLVQTSNCVREHIFADFETTEERRILEENLLTIMRGIFPKELKSKLDLEFQKVCNIVPLMDNAREMIQKLHQDGHRIIFITARSDDLIPNSVNNTLNYLEKNKIYYDELSFDNINKSEACSKFAIDVMIDDSPGVFKDIDQKCVLCLLFDNDINKDYKTDVKRVKNWLEIAEIIDNFSSDF